VLVLARRARCELYATDIRGYFVGATSHFLTRIGHGGRLGRDIHLEAQDARQFSYPDASFDRVFSISVLEHIPGDGDTRAMQEIQRVLRPGGVVTLTVPFAASGYREQFKRGDVYERRGDAAPTFYQRFYDLAALQARLVEPSGLALVETTFFGERSVRFEPYWNRIPIRWKVPLLWSQPFLAKVLLKRLGPDQMARACGVALKLTKPVPPAS
jgi:SAM-dependent methyltransferase